MRYFLFLCHCFSYKMNCQNTFRSLMLMLTWPAQLIFLRRQNKWCLSFDECALNLTTRLPMQSCTTMNLSRKNRARNWNKFWHRFSQIKWLELWPIMSSGVKWTDATTNILSRAAAIISTCLWVSKHCLGGGTVKTTIDIYWKNVAKQLLHSFVENLFQFQFAN